jgi:hypothetical protein
LGFAEADHKHGRHDEECKAASPWGEPEGDKELAELMNHVACPSFNRLGHWEDLDFHEGRPARTTSPSPTLTMILTRKSGAANERTALSRELNFAVRNLQFPVWAQAAVAARHVRNASSRRTRSVWRDVRWRWTLKVFWTAA